MFNSENIRLPDCFWSGECTDPAFVQLQQQLPNLLTDLSELLSGWGTTPAPLFIHIAANRLEFRKSSKIVGYNLWAVGHTRQTPKGKPCHITIIHPRQWEVHDPANFTAFFLHEITHAWQMQCVGNIWPLWWAEGLAYWASQQLQPGSMHDLRKAWTEGLHQLLSQKSIQHLDKLRYNILDMIRILCKRNPRYPFIWNYAAGMAVCQVLGKERIGRVIDLWISGQSATTAISEIMKIPWTELGRIPGPLIQLLA